MARPKIHALRKLSYVPDEENNYTLCYRHVKDLRQIAPSNEGVTCKQCLASLKLSADSEAYWQAYMKRYRGVS